MRFERLLQDIHREDPWKMLVCCQLLNQTRREQVDGVIDELFERYPDAGAMAAADPRDLSKVIHSLGLQNRRALGLIRFSQEWLSDDHPCIDTMHGIGKYALDSWIIFQSFYLQPGNVSIDAIEDKELRAYLERRKTEDTQ